MKFLIVTFSLFAALVSSAAVLADKHMNPHPGANCPKTPCEIKLRCFKLTVSLKYKSGNPVPDAEGALHRSSNGTPNIGLGNMKFDQQTGIATRRLCTDGAEEMYINVSSTADAIYAGAFAVIDKDFAIHFQVPNP